MAQVVWKQETTHFCYAYSIDSNSFRPDSVPNYPYASKPNSNLFLKPVQYAFTVSVRKFAKVRRLDGACCCCRWIPVKPCTEAALAVGIACVVVTKGLYDKKFIASLTLHQRLSEDALDISYLPHVEDPKFLGELSKEVRLSVAPPSGGESKPLTFTFFVPSCSKAEKALTCLSCKA